MEQRVEQIGGGVQVHTSARHTFGTDSLLLADFAWRHTPPAKEPLACDLGSGCGIVPLLWFREQPAPQTALAVDVQPEAVELLHRSVAASGLSGRLVPLLADLRDLRAHLPADMPPGRFGLVTCNPPYKAVGTGVPSRAESDRIARHETLCTLDDVCAAAKQLLRFGGRLCLCQLPERLVDVLEAMRAHQIEPKRLRFVQQTAQAAPWLLLVEGKRGAKPFLQVEPPLIMREGAAPTPELAHIYRHYGKI